ncbi:hypothetical protein MTP04_32960 [Lysinibacillus sp. PLM2]|nr:hypothetical protein MTP04_32960 [Lysinibacillus sp. PLM2]
MKNVIKIIHGKGMIGLEHHQHVVEKETNAAASLSILLAVLGFILSLMPLVGWILAPFFWVLAILFGMVGLHKEVNRGAAILGIAIGLVTFMYKIALMQIFS